MQQLELNHAGYLSRGLLETLLLLLDSTAVYTLVVARSERAGQGRSGGWMLLARYCEV